MNLERLLELREDNHLKQSDIAKILHISQQQYSLYESGERQIPIEKLSLLADYFHVSIDYLLKRTQCKHLIEDQYFIDTELNKFILYYSSLDVTNRDIILGEMAKFYKEQEAAKTKPK
ncbi:MAG: helix-turn-helix transcriptional regulator [Lachnospiraceae bacterium]|nr:helix-turn-helix transcriptional regulator [Lachnospiraceae bacterium]